MVGPKIRQMLRTVSIMSCLFASPASTQETKPALRQTAAPAPLFVITYRAGPSWKADVPIEKQGLRDHFYYWKALDERGKVVIAGQLEGDAGLIVLRAANQLEAEQVIADDPAFKAGLFEGDARPFTPRFVGKISVSPVKP